jgi:hypothetical protein
LIASVIAARTEEKMIELEHEMIYRLEVAGPVQADDGSGSNPRRQVWQMSRATLLGPRIDASTAMPGIDWFTPYPNGYGRPHVRLSFLANDGALLLLEYRGIVEASRPFLQAIEEDTPTRWEDQYMRMALTFDTASPRYEWLTQNLFIARGRLLGRKSLEYDVYRIK